MNKKISDLSEYNGVDEISIFSIHFLPTSWYNSSVVTYKLSSSFLLGESNYGVCNDWGVIAHDIHKYDYKFTLPHFSRRDDDCDYDLNDLTDWE